MRAKLIDSVEVCARRVLETATQCISASQAGYFYNSNPAICATLGDGTKELADHILLIIDSSKANFECFVNNFFTP